jgi:AcrR family transcriptional regulator
MARRRQAEGDDVDLGAEPASVVRRAPFSDNPTVGARGQRAQQRILEAALKVFGEVGYHQTGIVGITEVAGCSRASFYQYFSSKEDVFRRLAGDVGRALSASAGELPVVGPDAAGWAALREWVGRYADIYDRYEPVFQAFQAAAESDDAVASGSVRLEKRHVARLREKVADAATLPPRHLDAAINVLLNCVTRTQRITGVLRAAMPSGALPRPHVDAALADIWHRTLFGLDADVNVQPPSRRSAARVRHSAAIVRDLVADTGEPELTPSGARTLNVLLEAAHEVLVKRGYHGTRIDDITDVAGMSHGAFYRYFENKEEVVRLLALRAIRRVGQAFDEIPAIDEGPDALRAWLTRYARAHATETALIRVWFDATADDPLLRVESAAALDWGRARLVRVLHPRGFGDVEMDALLLVVLLDTIGAQPRSADVLDAAALVVERALLGVSPDTPQLGTIVK